MGFRKKWITVTLCKSARSAIQLFHIHYRKYFAIIRISAVYLSSARVSMIHTLVPLLIIHSWIKYANYVVTLYVDVICRSPKGPTALNVRFFKSVFKTMRKG